MRRKLRQRLRRGLRSFPRAYWRYLAGVFAHGIGDFAPTLLILRASQILAPRLGVGRAAAISVGLYTFHNLVDATASYPAGALGDRIGKRGLLAIGYIVGVASYAGFIFGRPTIPVLVFSLDLRASMTHFSNRWKNRWRRNCCRSRPRHRLRRAGDGNGIGDLVSSIAVGALWSFVSPRPDFYTRDIRRVGGGADLFVSRARLCADAAQTFIAKAEAGCRAPRSFERSRRNSDR